MLFPYPTLEQSKAEIYSALVRTQESETCYKTLFEDNPQSMLIMDMETLRFLTVNKAAANHYGYSKEEFSQISADQIQCQDETPEGPPMTLTVINPLDSVYRHRRKDGSKIDVRVATHDILFDGRRAKILLIDDVTETRRAERCLNFLTDSGIAIADCLCLKSTLEKVMQLAALQFNGFCSIHLQREDKSNFLAGCAHQDELLSQNFREALAKIEIDVASPRGIGRVISTGQSELSENGFVIDSRLQSFNLRSHMCAPLRTRGKTIGAITLFSAKEIFDGFDLTVFETFARRVAQAVDNAKLYDNMKDALRLRDDFISIASHELRTPLTALKLNLQYMQRIFGKELEPGTFLERAERILLSSKRQVDRVDRLIQDLLDLSRIRTGHISLDYENIDLGDLVLGLVDRYREPLREAGCSVAVDFHKSVVGYWDRSKLELIVTNLLTNAMKYGAKNPVEISIYSEFNYAIFRIRDHGIGINEKDKEKIFNKFERGSTKLHARSSLGLGLFLVKQFVRVLGGTIDVQSTFGQGAEFTFKLPLKPKNFSETADPQHEVVLLPT